MEIKVKNIKWDTDGMSAKKLGLPKNVTFSVSDEEYKEILEDMDALTDKLSDEYGFCVESYTFDYE